MRVIKAVQFEATGGPEVMKLVELPIGEPGPGQVRVVHKAIGLNFIDTYIRSGLYKTALPGVPGGEAAGIVDAIGPDVKHVAVGDRVAYTTNDPGSYAEARVVPAFVVVKLPDAVSFETGAGMLLKGLTVQYLLRRTRVSLFPGDHILWHAAAGGVGLIACQWARSLGLKLIGTASTDEKCALAIEHGASNAINYRRDDVPAKVREITGGAGVPVVYDSVGKDTWEMSLDCLQPLGLMVSFGNASGPVPPISLSQLVAKGSLYVHRPVLFAHLSSASNVQQMSGELFTQIATGMKIPIERTYPLADAVRAHQEMESRATTGAGVLIP